MNGEAIRVGLHPKAWGELSTALKDGTLAEGKSANQDGREAILRR